eukprot:CAMPEP_0175099978 /NCGR_PEP_ID=MMETSP0086_2-20121207/6778_1 /TAXON_ID=136419 /ORGANISM="Unknown Unknown, Strain D1" /LENGTH=142 /DNA_ID=CAMNT_0016373931 /DNA_START=40 /DNA_END=465 /DNA_ORIENTATION=+
MAKKNAEGLLGALTKLRDRFWVGSHLQPYIDLPKGGKPTYRYPAPGSQAPAIIPDNNPETEYAISFHKRDEIKGTTLMKGEMPDHLSIPNWTKSEELLTKTINHYRETGMITPGCANHHVGLDFVHVEKIYGKWEADYYDTW